MAQQTAPSAWIPEDTLAMRLMQVRKSLRLSIEAIATTCGFATATWTQWETGVRPRDKAEVVSRVAEIYGVDPNWLMWGTPGGAGSGPPKDSASKTYFAGLPIRESAALSLVPSPG